MPRGREHKNLSSEVVFNPRRGLQSVWVALQPDCDLISLSAPIVWAWVGQLKGEAGNEHTKKAIATLSWNFRCCSQMPGLVDLPSHMNAFLTGLPWCRARQTRNMGMNQLAELILVIETCEKPYKYEQNRPDQYQSINYLDSAGLILVQDRDQYQWINWLN